MAAVAQRFLILVLALSAGSAGASTSTEQDLNMRESLNWRAQDRFHPAYAFELMSQEDKAHAEAAWAKSPRASAVFNAIKTLPGIYNQAALQNLMVHAYWSQDDAILSLLEVFVDKGARATVDAFEVYIIEQYKKYKNKSGRKAYMFFSNLTAEMSPQADFASFLFMSGNRCAYIESNMITLYYAMVSRVFDPGASKVFSRLDSVLSIAKEHKPKEAHRSDKFAWVWVNGIGGGYRISAHYLSRKKMQKLKTNSPVVKYDKFYNHEQCMQRLETRRWDYFFVKYLKW